MSFQNIAFLPSLTSFYTTFLNNCSGGYGFTTTTVLKLVGLSKGMLSIR